MSMCLSKSDHGEGGSGGDRTDAPAIDKGTTHPIPVRLKLSITMTVSFVFYSALSAIINVTN